MAKPLRILVVCGGPSSERVVSLRTAQMVIKNLDPKKYRPVLVTIQKNGTWKFGSLERSLALYDAIKKIVALKIDFVLIAMHGMFGEDGRMQALLEWMGLPYWGSGVLSSALAMDKHAANIAYERDGLRVPRYEVLRKGDAATFKIALPVVVKPVDGGSSVGVTIVRSKKELNKAFRDAFRESDRVMVQEYIQGREFTCGILENERGRAFALPPTEIVPKRSSFFDYRAKYEAGGSDEITPARLSSAKLKELQRLALQAHNILGCAGMSRSDFILKGQKFYLLETNTIPGMTGESLLPKAAQVVGIDFPKLLDIVIASGLRREK